MSLFKSAQQALLLSLIMICTTSSWAATVTGDNENQTTLRAILLGPPGSGKGTVGEKLSQKINVPIITASSLLKKVTNQDNERAKQITQMIQSGQLIPDQLMCTLLAEELKLPKYQHGFILDGFPRTIEQAQQLAQAHLVIDYVIVLSLDDAAIINRMSGRLVHPSSGRVYHQTDAPPKVKGRDDSTGEPLVRRPDDRPEILTQRLATYHLQTEPLIAWAKDQQQREDGIIKAVIEISTQQDAHAVSRELMRKISAQQ